MFTRHGWMLNKGFIVMKTKFRAMGLLVTLIVLSVSVANATEANTTTTKPTPPACGGARHPNSCPGKCYDTYQTFICGNPRPGQVGKARKELKQCYASCKQSK